MEEVTKYENWSNAMLSTPSLDVEEYSKLRTRPFPQQSCTNLPYYFLEPEHPGPRLTSSDLDVFPLDQLGERDADKLKRLYVCLKEECGFKKYLSEEKRIGLSSVESNRVYSREISGSDFRILNIKDDIAQFTHYLNKAYNLKGDKFDSVLEAGLAAALSSCSMLRCFGLASIAISTDANFYMWVWLCILELVVVRMQSFIQLTLSNYANGTGYTTWSFCPYIKGLGMSLVMVEMVGGLATFWEAPLCFIKAWVSISVETFSNCTPTAKIEDDVVQLGHKYEGFMDGSEKRCFTKPDKVTSDLTCTSGTDPVTFQIFNSNYFFYYVKELSIMTPMHLTLNNGLLYLATLLLWFLMTRTVRNGFDKLIQRMHRGPLLLLAFLSISFTLAAITLKSDIAKEGTYAFFSLSGNFLQVDVIMTALLVSLSHVMTYYLEMGSKMPFKWDPDAIFSWKATAHLSIYFLTMWLSYLAIYYEKHFYNMKDISCISSEIYLMNSALPRFFNSLFFMKYMGLIYFLLQAYTNYLISTTLVTIVWRNLSHNIDLLKKYPQIQYVFDFGCLVVIIVTMIGIRGYQEYWDLLQHIRYMESVATAVLTICFMVAVLTYYGPSRVWVDLQFLTRRRIHPSLHLNLIVFFFVILSLAVLGVPKVLEKFMKHQSLDQVMLICLLIVPFVVTLITFLLSKDPITEVRQFHFWGERSEREQNERLRFNPAQFKTSYLRNKEIDMHESGDDFYRDQRKKALVRIALILNASED